MNRKNLKTFYTGEFAKRFGIKKDTLFYYDKINLFKPAGISDNGYRYYTMQQLDTFWAIHSLRSLNFPIKELKNYFSAPSSEKLTKLAKDQLLKVEEEIKNLQEIHWLLSEIMSRSEEIKNATLGEVVIVELPEEPVIYSAPNPRNSDTSNEEWSYDYEVFLEQTGLKGPASIGSVISEEDILHGRFKRVERLFTRIKIPNAKIKPAGLYAILYHKGTYESIPGAYPFLLNEISNRGFRVSGNAYEEYLIDTLATNNEADFVTKISLAVNYK
ncbi:MerR family transcriptional regulator [Bacillus atrophaeus]|uniref:MerR family transcriptional regulator n=1 Tax=Bacillus atrophaeus TaxID=1452 RepID=UPI00227DD772|nr:MerR family transcriptional regulator [Bacillus atrophaeus]MCY8514192.1 MerR family transcriptional regulator [Bacillus atrophaeus]MCY8517986.1 MerR family transcriptional regulator [Bacillus atrophaeus]MCY8991387.1 MerR family transcriptional regulator [Bacillus atrophaeus]